MMKNKKEESHMTQTELAFAVTEEQKQTIINDVLPQLIQIFGEHVVRIVSFEHDELSYINLAVLVKDYSTELYEKDIAAVHIVTESVNKDICILSVIVIDYNSAQNHVLYPDLRKGTEIYNA